MPDFVDPSEPHGTQVVEYIMPAEEDEDSFDPSECTVVDKGRKIDLSYKRKAVTFWKSGKKARRTITSVQKNYRMVKSLQQLYRWEASVETGGTNADKFAFITEDVLQMFKEACDRRSIVHDMNLRLWDLEAKKNQVGLPQFVAGKWWISNFKTAHRIGSRQITTFRTQFTFEDIDNIKNIAQSFVSCVKSNIPAVGVEEMCNTDESGFSFEIHSGRT